MNSEDLKFKVNGVKVDPKAQTVAIPGTQKTGQTGWM
jgi:hypothetical protein